MFGKKERNLHVVYLNVDTRCNPDNGLVMIVVSLSVRLSFQINLIKHYSRNKLIPNVYAESILRIFICKWMNKGIIYLLYLLFNVMFKKYRQGDSLVNKEFMITRMTAAVIGKRRKEKKKTFFQTMINASL